jgi:hypothetical protein
MAARLGWDGAFPAVATQLRTASAPMPRRPWRRSCATASRVSSSAARSAGGRAFPQRQRRVTATRRLTARRPQPRGRRSLDQGLGWGDQPHHRRDRRRNPPSPTDRRWRMSTRNSSSAVGLAEGGCAPAGRNAGAWRAFLGLLGFPRGRERYEPSEHYMRGPGPRTRQALSRPAAEANGRATAPES